MYVYAVFWHNFEPDYKRAESTAEMVGVFSEARPAYLTALHYNREQMLECEDIVDTWGAGRWDTLRNNDLRILYEQGIRFLEDQEHDPADGSLQPRIDAYYVKRMRILHTPLRRRQD